MNTKIGSIILAAAAAGFAAGITVQKIISEKRGLLSSEKVLSLVKKTVKEKLPVDGAWIFLSPHKVTKDALTAEVYQGGLTVRSGDSVSHYDFIADARAGTLLELKKQP